MASQMRYTTEKLIDLLGMADIGEPLSTMLNNLNAACAGDPLSTQSILRELSYLQRYVDSMLAEEQAEKAEADEAERLSVKMDEEDKLDYKYRTGRYCLL